MKKKTQQQFIDEATAKHNGKYDYSKSVYVRTMDKVEIICPEHGSFWQIPNDHLKGIGCPKCAGRIVTTDDFIVKSSTIHKNHYDYSKSVYIGAHKKVEIICPEHGSFWQKAAGHIIGYGCPKCGGVSVPTTEEWIAKATAIHNNRYDYSKVIYANANSKVEIVCPKHGPFWQTPRDHVKPAGCPKCKASKGENKIRQYLVENNLHFAEQKRVKLKGYHHIFDFVIKTPFKTIVIEFNGRQHYIPIGFGSKKDHADFRNLMGNIGSDYEKYQRCKANNVCLLVVPYWDIERIEEILTDFFDGNELTFSQPPQRVVDLAPQRKRIRERLGITEADFLCGIYGTSP